MASKTVIFLLAGCVGLLTLAGCAEPNRQAAMPRICAADSQKPLLMEAAETVLTDMHFAIEKADPNAGLIKTRPLTAAQFFEFWRSDNVGPANSLEANIQTIRRVAQLHLRQQDARLCLTCSVTAYRLNMPENQISSSGRAYTMFTRSTSSLQKITLEPEQTAAMVWTNLGPDQSLAAEILRRIQQKIAQPQKDEKI